MIKNEEILGLRGGALPKRRSTALRPVRRFGGRRARVQFPAEPAITLVTNRPGDLRAPSTWFHYFDPAAREVFVAGDFNNWNPAATPMFRSAGGEWSAQIDLPPGAYEYRFVADGVWKTDPKAESKANGFGEQNSIKRVQAV